MASAKVCSKAEKVYSDAAINDETLEYMEECEQSDDCSSDESESIPDDLYTMLELGLKINPYCDDIQPMFEFSTKKCKKENTIRQHQHDKLASKLIDFVNAQIKSKLASSIVGFNFLITLPCGKCLAEKMIEKTRKNLDKYYLEYIADKKARDMRLPTKYLKPLQPLSLISDAPDARVATHREVQVPDRVDSATKLAILARMAALSDDDDDSTPNP